jgi:gliding motility-associated-like protein
MSIGGQVNDYYAISAIGINSVTCTGEDLSSLQAGDKVMLYQVTGAMIDTSHSEPVNFPVENGQAPAFHGSGRFELLSVYAVDNSGKVVTFTSDIKRSYDVSERVQLIRIVENDIISVDSDVTCAAWDGFKGGVVVIVAFKKLIMNADIDVSSKGFRGGIPETYNIGCRPSSSADTFYFKAADMNRAGNKGEGILKINFPYPKGPGNALNGGGGAIGLYGGGGGGSLYNSGGPGDYQDNGCASDFSQRPWGGYRIDTGYFARNYEIDPDERWPAFAFGGGGGSSTENAGGNTVNGGRGGGIILILTDTLIGNNQNLISDGESISIISTGGAPGGGAGGMVVVDADYITESLNVSVNGGDGGDASDSNGNCGGSGGGGAGGIYWYNGASIPSGVSCSYAGGQSGNTDCGQGFSGDGQQGKLLNYYEPLLNGFVFNSISDNDTICSGQIPNLIVGTMPKGVATPVYSWLESDNNINWTLISGETNKDFQPGSLTSSKYYTRVVKNDDDYYDTAYSVYVHVFPVITGNSLSLRDTICSGTAPGLLNANSVSGGNGTYSYIWESTNDTSFPVWTSRSADELFTDNSLPSQSVYYRRIVISAKVCIDTSLKDTITVLDPIMQNDLISPDTTICTGLDAGTIIAATPSGGDGTYKFSWIISSDGNSYSAIGGANNETYSPGVLNDTRYYKRVIISGNDDVCKDTTSSHVVSVLPSLNNIDIFSDSTKYCYEDIPLKIKGNTLISGGDNTYNYQWHRLNGSVWESITNATGIDYNPPSLTDTSSFRRSVVSGADDACRDTSNTLVIRIVPQISNTLSTNPDDICENSIPEGFNELPASGGDGNYNYLWRFKDNIGNNWTNAPGINSNASYISGELINSKDFQRIAYSDICSDTSNSITVVVYPSIKQNEITGLSQQYVCYNSSKELIGSDPKDGNSTYSYKWLESEDGSAWTSIDNSENKNLNTDKLTTEKLFKRIVLSGDLEQCIDTSDQVRVSILDLPTGDIVSKLDTLCQQDIIQVNYENLTGASPWIISIGESNSVRTEMVQQSSGILSFPLDTTVNLKILSLRDNNACFADTSLSTGLVNAFVYELPVAFAGETKTVCGKQTQLDAAFTVDNSFGAWTISGGVVEPAGSPNGLLSIEDYGEYTLLWRESTSSDCFSEDEVIITFFEQPVEVNAGNDIEEDYSFIHQLNAEPTDVGSGSWSYSVEKGSLEFDDSTLFNATVTLSDIGTYYLKWTIENGICESISDEIVIINNPQEIYEGFSPNGDGINDIYTVKLKEGHTGELIILDKNGRIIQTILSVGNLITWDGTRDSGTELPEGTYYFILREENVEDQSGFIELRKSY